ncbi:hypothetical protein [Bradyrhizobium sp. LHD-71]|uniref:hypothetical protein n=1 Tax=Bradyrhizobium sp. LHD-71 TaxID=3072141 RepID=UPI00280C852C|nr:hypothetical protein [Bradyrhizobium sp. LHD-71]MDQ8730088.1 hypothetical protein [Bradyrhizobium sp. LHD-71]
MTSIKRAQFALRNCFEVQATHALSIGNRVPTTCEANPFLILRQEIDRFFDGFFTTFSGRADNGFRGLTSGVAACRRWLAHWYSTLDNVP